MKNSANAVCHILWWMQTRAKSNSTHYLYKVFLRLCGVIFAFYGSLESSFDNIKSDIIFTCEGGPNPIWQYTDSSDVFSILLQVPLKKTNKQGKDKQFSEASHFVCAVTHENLCFGNCSCKLSPSYKIEKRLRCLFSQHNQHWVSSPVETHSEICVYNLSREHITRTYRLWPTRS